MHIVTCTLRRSRDICGLAATHSYSGDPEPRCILHSGDPSKPHDQFRSQLERLTHPSGSLDFTGIVFPAPVFTFDEAVDATVLYDGATFLDWVKFEAKYDRGISFHRAVFRSSAGFDGRFGEADFGGAIFHGDVNLSHGQFHRTTNLKGAVFHRAVVASSTKFADASFLETEFRGRASFDMAHFRDLDLRRARFREPKHVSFFRLNHSFLATARDCGFRPRLRGCNLTDVRFQDVTWFSRNGRLTLQDELDAEQEPQEGYYPDVVPSRATVSGLYRQLQASLEKIREFELAEECIVSAMEMKRLDQKASRSHRAVVNIYRFASMYGTDYLRALKVLAAALVTFGLLLALPVSGLRPTRPPGPAAGIAPAGSRSWGWAKQVARGVLCSFEVATLQRNARYVAETGFGRAVTVLETVVVPGQAALVLLALRRRFRNE